MIHGTQPRKAATTTRSNSAAKARPAQNQSSGRVQNLTSGSGDYVSLSSERGTSNSRLGTLMSGLASNFGNENSAPSLNRAGDTGGEGMGTNIRSDYDESARTNGHARLNPESRDSRLRDLDSISQLDRDGNTTNDGDRCGPSSVVAGAYYGGGVNGLRTLVSDMDRYTQQNNLDMNGFRRNHDLGGDPMAQVREHLRTGNVTRGDMNRIQENLYQTLQARQESVLGNGAPASGIADNYLGNFMQNAQGTRQIFDQNNLAIANVDTDGDGTGNHFVLGGQHNGQSFVYDPYSIRGENGQLDQVTQDQGQINSYRNAIDNNSWDQGQYTYNGGAR